ncbi:DUF4133 domain-containing protein [Alistipes putredinis]
MLVESRVRREVQARFGGEFLETYRRNTARHRVLSLRLRAQYLFLFAGGLLAVFILVVVLYMGGVDQVACLVAGVGLGGALVALTFRLNRKYGAYGLMKLLAARRHPRRIVSRKSVARILNRH